MSKDKQIEEMTEIICQNTEFDTMIPECEASAKALYTAGYRKSQDIAEEIFAEIEKILDQKFSINHGVVLISKEEFAALKKKYTEER